MTFQIGLKKMKNKRHKVDIFGKNISKGGIKMKVRDIMTKDVVFANKDDSVLTVAKLMKHHNVGAIAIV